MKPDIAIADMVPKVFDRSAHDTTVTFTFHERRLVPDRAALRLNTEYPDTEFFYTQGAVKRSRRRAHRFLAFGFGAFIGLVAMGLGLITLASPGEALLVAFGLSAMWLGFASALGSSLS